jgi:hypothetical protein
VTVTSAVPQDIGGQWSVAIPVATNIATTFYRLAQ